jgi:cysteine dioxygenase
MIQTEAESSFKQGAGILNFVDGITPKALTLPELEEILNQDIWTQEELDNWISFSDSTYSRNLIARNEHFEILCLCWKSGQKSTIHDHVGSNCAVKVIKGVCRETYYNKVSENTAKNSGKEARYLVGQVTSSGPGTFHRLDNPTDECLITLHVYSPPLSFIPDYEEVR